MVHHGAGLRALTEDPALVEALLEDYRTAKISSAQRAMLDYVVRLTVEPWALTESDIGRLREIGFEDRAILDMNQVAGYYAFVNRLADGLGVELEPDRE